MPIDTVQKWTPTNSSRVSKPVTYKRFGCPPRVPGEAYSWASLGDRFVFLSAAVRVACEAERFNAGDEWLAWAPSRAPHLLAVPLSPATAEGLTRDRSNQPSGLQRNRRELKESKALKLLMPAYTEWGERGTMAALI
jgi:hypothetical protein